MYETGLLYIFYKWMCLFTIFIITICLEWHEETEQTETDYVNPEELWQHLQDASRNLYNF